GKLPGDLTPRRMPVRLVVAAATRDRRPTRPNEDGRCRFRDCVDPCVVEQVADSDEVRRGRPKPGQVVEERQRVRLPAPELRRQVENGVRPLALAGEPPDRLAREAPQALGDEGTRQEALRLAVLGRSLPGHYLVEGDGELRRVERRPPPQVLPRRRDLVPGSQ